MANESGAREGVNMDVFRCATCRRVLDADWSDCPTCGEPIPGVDWPEPDATEAWFLLAAGAMAAAVLVMICVVLWG